MQTMRKLIGFDDDTLDKLTQLGRDRMATLQDLADEAFADLLKKHGEPIDLKDALRKSAGVVKKHAKTKSTNSNRSPPSLIRTGTPGEPREKPFRRKPIL